MLRKVFLDSESLLSDVGGGGLLPVHELSTDDLTVSLSNKNVFINDNGR